MLTNLGLRGYEPGLLPSFIVFVQRAVRLFNNDGTATPPWASL